jgi:hypothetical protein
MAWYDDEHKESHTQKYENAELAYQDAHRAQAKGWEVQVRGRRIRRPYNMFDWIDAPNYQRGEVELTFIRTEEWLEQHRKV